MVMGYQKVLVAFDGSEGSKAALDHAIGIVKQNDGELTVVHVVKKQRKATVQPIQTMGAGPGAANFPSLGGGPGVIPIHNEAGSAAEHQNSFEAERNEILRRGEDVISDAHRILSKEPISANHEVLEGDPAQKICQYAEDQASDLIVIGNRGLSGLKKWVLGSVSQEVTQNASCPVLVVK